MLSRALLLLALALFPASCSSEYAGISRASAVGAAKAYVVRVDYRGDEPLFYRNTGNKPTVVRHAEDTRGQRACFVRFDDFQAQQRRCVTVRRTPRRVVTKSIAC
jgi:hypothetical protein